jgi:hypothetical protein
MKSKKDHNELWEADFHIDEVKGEALSDTIARNRDASAAKQTQRAHKSKRPPIRLLFNSPGQPDKQVVTRLIADGLAVLITARIARQLTARPDSIEPETRNTK